MKPKYIIKEGQEGEPRIVQKINTTIEIPLDTLANELKYFEKTITELEAQKKLDEAVLKNIIDHNSDIEILPDEKKHAIMMYYQTKLKIDKINETLEQAKKTNQELVDMSTDIEKQTGLKPF